MKTNTARAAAIVLLAGACLAGCAGAPGGGRPVQLEEGPAYRSPAYPTPAYLGPQASQDAVQDVDRVILHFPFH